MTDENETYKDLDNLTFDQRIKAIFRLIIPIAVFILGQFGFDFDGELAWTIVCDVVTLVTFVWAWWKNNNWTREAVEAQIVLDELKEDK